MRAARRIEKRIATVHTLLDAQSTLVLSTAGSEAEPHATPLYYLATPRLDLFWLSSRSTRHSQALALHPRASAAVFVPTFEWRQIAGVQMEGICAIAGDDERALHLEAYCARFHLGSVLSAVISRSTLYRFRPTWLRYIDNRKRFGYRFELTLPED